MTGSNRRTKIGSGKNANDISSSSILSLNSPTSSTNPHGRTFTTPTGKNKTGYSITPITSYSNVNIDTSDFPTLENEEESDIKRSYFIFCHLLLDYNGTNIQEIYNKNKNTFIDFMSKMYEAYFGNFKVKSNDLNNYENYDINDILNNIADIVNLKGPYFNIFNILYNNKALFNIRNIMDEQQKNYFDYNIIIYFYISLLKDSLRSNENSYSFEFEVTKDTTIKFHKPIFYLKLQEPTSEAKTIIIQKQIDSLKNIQKQIDLLKNTQKVYNKENLQSKLTNCIDFDMVDS